MVLIYLLKRLNQGRVTVLLLGVQWLVTRGSCCLGFCLPKSQIVTTTVLNVENLWWLEGVFVTVTFDLGEKLKLFSIDVQAFSGTSYNAYGFP